MGVLGCSDSKIFVVFIACFLCFSISFVVRRMLPIATPTRP